MCPQCLLVCCLLTFTSQILAFTSATLYHDYCIVGAGPSGLQLGYFFKTSGRDYIIFERSNRSGSFFELYPRHRKLISLNKRNTGKANKEFNLRHDWNSLISHDDDLLVTKYSNVVFPNADVLLTYLDDFRRKLDINVQFNTNIKNIRTVVNMSAPDGHVFNMDDQIGQTYTCRNLVLATGVSTPNIPSFPGVEHAVGYESMSIDPQDYEGKTVLILGRGNAAFEIADSIYGNTNLIHMIARSRVRLAWATHYVGDLRAVNNALLDTYQLKSLDGLLETSLNDVALVKKGDKIHFTVATDDFDTARFDNFALREPYDIVIRALGFQFDDSVFNNTAITRGKARAKKYPAINHNYESVDLKGLFYAGTASHSLDFRKSSGGFIHGFRYTARALHRLLEWRYEGVRWPSTEYPVSQLLTVILKRINEASGPYQMFEMLGDIVLFTNDGDSFVYIEEFPVHLLHKLYDYTGLNGTAVMVIVMEYGHNFSGPGKDVFRTSRATGEPSEAHTSNFLHPVFYFYRSLPTEKMMRVRKRNELLPMPDLLHHVVEDFLTQWESSHSHILPLRRFLENVLQLDLRSFFTLTCFEIAMTHAQVPEQCGRGYMQGQGLVGTKDLLDTAMSLGMMDLAIAT